PWGADAGRSARWTCLRSAPSAPGRERGHRDDHRLRADPPVEEGVPVPGLVLAELGGIDEEVVVERDEVAHAEAPAGEAQVLLVLGHVGGARHLRAQILPELVAEVARRV